MAKVYVSIPCANGQIHQKTILTLENISFRNEIKLHFIENCSLITKARQDHFAMFLNKTKDDYLLSVDSDLVLGPPGILDDMIDKCPENSIIGGLYAMKALDMEGHSIFNGSTLENDKNIVLNGKIKQMKYIPNGFMLIPRKTALKLTEIYSDLSYEDHMAGKCWAVYNTMIIKDSEGINRFLPEDFSFCERVLGAGMNIYAHTGCMLGHIGQFLYHLEEYRTKNG